LEEGLRREEEEEEEREKASEGAVEARGGAKAAEEGLWRSLESDGKRIGSEGVDGREELMEDNDSNDAVERREGMEAEEIEDRREEDGDEGGERERSWKSAHSSSKAIFSSYSLTHPGPNRSISALLLLCANCGGGDESPRLQAS
jgi:hypothetical protein